MGRILPSFFQLFFPFPPRRRGRRNQTEPTNVELVAAADAQFPMGLVQRSQR